MLNTAFLKLEQALNVKIVVSGIGWRTPEQEITQIKVQAGNRATTLSDANLADAYRAIEAAGFSPQAPGDTRYYKNRDFYFIVPATRTPKRTEPVREPFEAFTGFPMYTEGQIEEQEEDLWSWQNASDWAASVLGDNAPAEPLEDLSALTPVEKRSATLVAKKTAKENPLPVD